MKSEVCKVRDRGAEEVPPEGTVGNAIRPRASGSLTKGGCDETSSSLPQEGGGKLRFAVAETFRLGDLVYLVAFLYGLREAFPNATIAVLISEASGQFEFPADLGVEVRKAYWPWIRLGWWRRPLRTILDTKRAAEVCGSFDGRWIGLDPRGDPRHWVALRSVGISTILSATHAKRNIASIRGTPERHVLGMRRDFLEKVVSRYRGVRPVNLRWPWKQEAGVRRICRERTVLLAPEASHAAKELPGGWWIELAQMLRAEGWRTTLIVHKGGVVSERQWGQFDRVFRGTIKELGQAISEAWAVVAVDSFVGHLAAAQNCRVVSLFGPTDPKLWRPAGERVAIVRVRQLARRLSRGESGGGMAAPCRLEEAIGETMSALSALCRDVEGTASLSEVSGAL